MSARRGILVAGHARHAHLSSNRRRSIGVMKHLNLPIDLPWRRLGDSRRSPLPFRQRASVDTGRFAHSLQPICAQLQAICAQAGPCQIKSDLGKAKVRRVHRKIIGLASELPGICRVAHQKKSDFRLMPWPSSSRAPRRSGGTSSKGHSRSGQSSSGCRSTTFPHDPPVASDGQRRSIGAGFFGSERGGGPAASSALNTSSSNACSGVASNGRMPLATESHLPRLRLAVADVRIGANWTPVA